MKWTDPTWLLVGLALPLMPATGQQEPRIAGATLTEWRQLMADRDPRDERNAADVPGLIALVESPDVPWFTRRQAALTLGRWDARPAVPVLLRFLEEVGSDPETGPQQWSLKALARFGPAGAPAVPRIVALVLDEATPRLNRLNGLEALSQIGAAHPLVIPTLTDMAAQSDDLDLRIAAVESLGVIGPPALTALPTLLRLLDEPAESLRYVACGTLGRLGPRGEPAAAALIERLLFDDVPLVQDAAVTALTNLGPGIGPEIVPFCEAPEPRVRHSVFILLGKWGRESVRWWADIERGWSDEEPEVRLAALAAGLAIGSDSRELAQRLVQFVVSEDRAMRREAVRLLVQLGPKAARPPLAALIDHPRVEVRAAVRSALQTLDSRGQTP